ncbi:MAG: nitrate/sulfonate/bicarbonate ABC transporter ATP-binding protein [Blastopirellula sp.]|nr:MAG: nitrate/sulfonate/bicarbonate ABC transporter ATP-binding protein [Blastopirellula sp.]
MIEISEVHKSFENHANVLSNINVQIEQRQFVSIVGPSGCGKSTLLRLVAGLDVPTSGQITVDGDSPSHRLASRTAFVFQDATLLPWRTAAGNVRLPLELQNNVNRQTPQTVRDTLSLVGLLPSDADKYPRMLSGGMQMRTSLARAIVTEPEVLLLDEPFGALDDILRQQLNEELLSLWAKKKWTTIFVTHNVSEAVFLSNRVLVMSHRPGQIAADIAVPFEYPRNRKLRSDSKFAELCGQVSEHLREAAAV